MKSLNGITFWLNDSKYEFACTDAVNLHLCKDGKFVKFINDIELGALEAVWREGWSEGYDECLEGC